MTVPRPVTQAMTAIVALVVGLLLLGSGHGTLAAWSDAREADTIKLGAGSVSLTRGTTAVQLLSRQPAGSRRYDSTTTCPVPTGFTECRVITATIATERVAPGDTLRFASTQTLTASGNNLRGTLAIDATAVRATATSQLSQVSTVSTTVTPPGGAATVSGALATFPVRVSTGAGIGTYTVGVDVAIPANDNGGGWGTALQGQLLDLTTITTTFTQE